METSAVLITVMNRSGVKDSKLSLDELRFMRDHSTMSLYPYKLYYERIDHTRNMAGTTCCRSNRHCSAKRRS